MYLILNFCISAMWVDVWINFWISLKNKKTTIVNFRCLRRNHQQKIRWFLLSKKKKNFVLRFLFTFSLIFFCFLHLNQVFWDFRGTIRLSPIKRFILKLRGVCTSQDIFKRKQKIEIKKKHFFYLPFYFTWPKYNEKWVVHLFYFPVGPYVILAILGVMEWDPRISVRNFNLVLLFFPSNL